MLAEMARRLLQLVSCTLALALCLTAAGSPPAGQRSAVVVEVRDSGFHWGDAAIGSATTLGLLLAAGGLHALRRSAVLTPRTRKRHLS